MILGFPRLGKQAPWRQSISPRAIEKHAGHVVYRSRHDVRIHHAVRANRDRIRNLPITPEIPDPVRGALLPSEPGTPPVNALILVVEDHRQCFLRQEILEAPRTGDQETRDLETRVTDPLSE